MLTYEQKRVFLIVVVLIMLVPMILVAFGRHIRLEIHNIRCPAIREVGEFQKVFNEYAAADGLSIDLKEAEWAAFGEYYSVKTVPVHGTEATLYCSVVGNYEGYGAQVMQVEFYGEYGSEADVDTEQLVEILTTCFRIFAPTVYSYYDYIPSYDGDYSYAALMEKAIEIWSLEEAEFFDSFISDDVRSDNIDREQLFIQSRKTKDGMCEKSFRWS